jgi:hypothetical protein
MKIVFLIILVDSAFQRAHFASTIEEHKQKCIGGEFVRKFSIISDEPYPIVVKYCLYI